jgi:hypothetical protein
MLNTKQSGGVNTVFSGEPAYVPPVESVVAPSVLAEVFEDGKLPFPTNADGSVNMAVYMGWLAETWAGGMAQFDAQSEPADGTENQTMSAAA